MTGYSGSKGGAKQYEYKRRVPKPDHRKTHKISRGWGGGKEKST